jgi:hypothetical protein
MIVQPSPDPVQHHSTSSADEQIESPKASVDQDDSQELSSVSDIQDQARKRQADFKAIRLEPASIIGRRATLKGKHTSDWFNCFVVDYDPQRSSAATSSAPSSPSSPTPRGAHLLHYDKKKDDDKKGQLLWVDLKDREFTLEDAMTIAASQAAVAANPEAFYGQRINLRNQASSFISGEILDYDAEDRKHELQFDNGQTILMKLKRYDFVLVNDTADEEEVEERSRRRSSRKSSRRGSAEAGSTRGERRSSPRGSDDGAWNFDLGLFKISFGS